MYKFIKIRHDIIKQCHGNYKEKKKINYKLEIGIFRNSTQKYLGVLRVFFKGLGVQKGTQTPCWLRPCLDYYNGLLCGITDELLLQATESQKQCCQSGYSGSKKYDRITPILKELHWLPIRNRNASSLSLST